MHDVVIVGGGIAGLTAAAYLTKAGKSVKLLEKGDKVGGLVSTFNYKGFTLDGGIRSIENSGIVFPMLKDLGITVPFKRSVVSMGLVDKVIKIEEKDAVIKYQNLLIEKFPDNEKEIKKIMKTILKLMNYMDILYGIDNPLFLDFKRDRKYLLTKILPWMFKFLFTVGKIKKYRTPIETYISNITENESLNNVIAQHFFNQTPTFFALSYFSLYLDYNYPLEGTGMLIDKIKTYILEHGGDIQADTEVISNDIYKKEITDQDGNRYAYDKLIWAANLKHLYNNSNIDNIKEATDFQTSIKDLRGGDSIQTTYMLTNLDPSYFNNICTPHFFYTPTLKGDGAFKKVLNDVIKSNDQDKMFDWIKSYLENTTFEISIPSARNEALAPKGKSALIVSVLMSFDLVNHLRSEGLYDTYKKTTESLMVEILNDSIFPKLKENIIETFSSSPLTILSRTNNTDGAITGWAFTNPIMPSVTSMLGISKSPITHIPNTYQAGQWSYSPAGLPISILTGKMAADKALKDLK